MPPDELSIDGSAWLRMPADSFLFTSCSVDYAECVDLLRKLVLTSLITLVPAGTILQAFCQVLFSLVFMGAHVRLW